MFVFALIVAVLVFVGFMSLVGSPSEAETMIGLVIAAVAFPFVFMMAWRMKSKAHEGGQNEKIAALERELEALKIRR
ncbi:MAG: hypothetical protein ACK4VZ_07225 [Paracoccaceae bacterium]